MEVDSEAIESGQQALENFVNKLSVSQSFMSDLGISPMSALAHNTASININPRKLSLNNCEDSPLPPVPISEKTSPMPVPSYRVRISPRNNSPRLLKNALKVSTPVGSAPRRSVVRRLTHDQPPPDRNENRPPSSPRAALGVANVNASPVKLAASPSKLGLGNQTRLRMPLDDFDPNSQDSGISCGSLDDSNKPFRFAAPSGVAPRKLSHNELSQSPRRFLTQSSNSSGGNSHCSIESLDDNFMDMLQNDKLMDDENAQLPSGLSSLLTDPILRHGDENARASISPGKQSNDNSPFMLRGPISFRRCLSENINNHNTSVEEFVKSKRPAPLMSGCNSPQSAAKRMKPLQEINHSAAVAAPEPKKRTLLDHGFVKQPRSLVEAKINYALSRSSEEELIGDFSQPFVLPLIKGTHEDLKNISSDTLADLINGRYEDQIATYQIIDCRFPYEFDGGHIKGARNIYTKDQLEKELIKTKPTFLNTTNSFNAKRHIIIFHCEFSSERGPTLSRFLRQRDRDCNRDNYPALSYPELYLLNGGYKAFFSTHSELCEPRAYLKMTDPRHESDLRLFRAKSKTWSGDQKHRPSKRPSSFAHYRLH
ncbi:hypothetical protein LSTR_LSTR001283 [Laodelphax striatellus]|uniref:protein-tyrosine-phosphatase n=1 Tax=Laodelphax striatellus TaxID=195883 RepID=A0A482XAW3_LAOST|nr:hypothetical protein LSTR_LSTR001283 [Laodelphax striatellus]